MQDKAIIGQYETTFNKKAEYVYCAKTNIEGFFIRTQNWHLILQQNQDIAPMVIMKIATSYIRDIHLKVGTCKRKAVNELQDRPDMNVIQATISKKENMYKLLSSCFEKLGIRTNLKLEEEYDEITRMDDGMMRV